MKVNKFFVVIIIASMLFCMIGNKVLGINTEDKYSVYKENERIFESYKRSEYKNTNVENGVIEYANIWTHKEVESSLTYKVENYNDSNFSNYESGDYVVNFINIKANSSTGYFGKGNLIILEMIIGKKEANKSYNFNKIQWSEGIDLSALHASKKYTEMEDGIQKFYCELRFTGAANPNGNLYAYCRLIDETNKTCINIEIEGIEKRENAEILDDKEPYMYTMYTKKIGVIEYTKVYTYKQVETTLTHKMEDGYMVNFIKIKPNSSTGLFSKGDLIKIDMFIGTPENGNGYNFDTIKWGEGFDWGALCRTYGEIKQGCQKFYCELKLTSESIGYCRFVDEENKTCINIEIEGIEQANKYLRDFVIIDEKGMYDNEREFAVTIDGQRKTMSMRMLSATPISTYTVERDVNNENNLKLILGDLYCGDELYIAPTMTYGTMDLQHTITNLENSANFEVWRSNKLPFGRS